MVRFILVFSIYFVWFTANCQSNSNKTVIAFGSCNDEAKPQVMWTEIIKQKPDLWIWGGDNIYADDNEVAASIKLRYQKQKSNPDYQRLLKSTAITGTWDDHDYGINDGGKFFARKRENKELFVDFIGFEKGNPIHKHDGIYNSTTLEKGNKKIKVINLDTRSFRDTVIKVSFTDSITNKKLTKYEMNLTGDVLSEAQWKWLREELSDKSIRLFIINSSIQVLATDHRFEKWGNFPTARKRLLNLVQQSNQKIIFISGDRHIAEISKLDLSGLPYSLYDFTSSGITHTWSEFWEEENSLRIGQLIIEKTFGIIRIDWSSTLPKITLEVRGATDKLFAEQAINLFSEK